MFPKRFFPTRYFTPRYFPIGGLPFSVIREWTLHRRSADLSLSARDNDLTLYARRRTLKPEDEDE